MRRKEQTQVCVILTFVYIILFSLVSGAHTTLQVVASFLLATATTAVIDAFSGPSD